MDKVLVDTSVWIDFFNGYSSSESHTLVEFINNDFPVYLCPTILQEILQGFKHDRDYKKAKELLLEFPFVLLDSIEAAIGAAHLYRTIRKKGKTIRKSNDCLIAYTALQYNIPLLQKDRDFAIIAEATGLLLV